MELKTEIKRVEFNWICRPETGVEYHIIEVNKPYIINGKSSKVVSIESNLDFPSVTAYFEAGETLTILNPNLIYTW